MPKSHSRWSRRFRFASFTAPRRPRHRVLRVVLGLVGVALLLGLLFVSVFVGLAMLAVGMGWRLWKQRGKPVLSGAEGRQSVRGRGRDGHLEGTYRVVGKAQLPLAH